MTTFGTSAYLKLLALNPRPRDTELRKRIWSPGYAGYDFHKAMRRIATEFSAEIADWPTTRAKLKAIKNPAERKSATPATFALMRWIDRRPIRLINTERKISSPNSVFSIKFSADFEIDIDGFPTQVHLWNTKTPAIRFREAIGVLGHFATEDTPRSVAILTLRTGELFLPSTYESARQLARTLALDVEERFIRISSEADRATRKAPPAERRIGR